MVFEYKLSTPSRECLVNITKQVESAISKSGILEGSAIIYCPHTTAGITINEGADPSVVKDIVYFLNDKIPSSYPFDHAEGNSDAHIKASFIGSSVCAIIDNGRILLGTWQAIFFCEFDGPRARRFLVKILS